MSEESQAADSSAGDREEVSTQQHAAHGLQKDSSSNAVSKLSAVATDQRKVSAIGRATISSVPKDELVTEDMRRKSTQMVVTNVKRISGSELKAEQNEETKDSSKHMESPSETADHRRVFVKDYPEDDQAPNDATVVKPKRRFTKPIADMLDSECTTSASRMTSENRVSSSDINVKSLTIDHQAAIQLSDLEAAAFECVLQECIELLDVLRYVIPAEVDARWDEHYKTVAQLYDVPDEPRIIFREDRGLLPLIPSVASKIQRDRTYVCEVLKRIAWNVKNGKTFESLEVEIDDIVKTQEGERDLQIDCELWTEQAKQLRELIEYDKVEFRENRNKKIEMAQQMNADVDNSIFLNGSQLGYVDRWEEAQIEKQELKLREKETELLGIRANCENLEKADQIVSGEVKTYLEANTREMEDEIISWTSQYIEELERRQQEMTEFKEHIGGQLVELHELKMLRDSRRAFIEEVLEEKEKMKREEDYWKQIHRAATNIQAHWRGYMVRKQIGPFRGLWTRLRKRKGHGAPVQNKKGTSRSKKNGKKNIKSRENP